MAINIQNTNYSGEVLEQLLTVAVTGNELVEKGLIHIEPGIKDKFSIPRLKTGRMLQKRKEQPEDSDSKGDFDYSEKVLKPVEFMAFTTFNPRSFEKIWRKWQPQGELVFAELPAEGQNALLAELAKQVKFELGFHFIQGQEGADDSHLFNGILTRIMADSEVIRVTTANTTMLGKLAAVKAKIPTVLRANPGLRILMSVEDFDQYDEELTAQPSKGANYTDTNVSRYKGIGIEYMANWPSGVIVATITGMDINTNLWAGVNLQEDMNVIKIAPLTNAGERYFFKMLMKADTQIAFGEECILLDSRTSTLSVTPTSLAEFTKNGGEKTVTVSALSEDYAAAVDNQVDWFTVIKAADTKIKVTAQANAGEARSGSFVVTLGDKSVSVAVSQAAGNV